MDRPTPASGPEHAERPPLPGATRVVVVGGGVAGVSTALFLAEWGVPVVLCEKGRVAGEQSSRNWGWIRRQGRDPRELPLMLESLALWRRLASELDEDIGFRQAGCTYLCATDEELATREAWLAHAPRLPDRLADALLGRGRFPARPERTALRGARSTPPTTRRPSPASPFPCARAPGRGAGRGRRPRTPPCAA